jgi:hypothetical protein
MNDAGRPSDHLRGRRRWPIALLISLSLSIPSSKASAQDFSGNQALLGASPGDSVWVTPRSRFPANFLQRLFLGDGHRELWETPVQVQILDLDRFAGGLTPFQRGGGLQTPSIRLRDQAGLVYTFRSLDKDAARALDPELRETLAAKFAQDFVSALLPLGAVVLDRIQEAAGVLHATPTLVLMPDDPRLGEFRNDFAGVLGWIQLRADEGPDGEPGFAGSDDVKGSEPFMEDLEKSPQNRANTRAYLKARLLDGLVGDWDRHPDQWRWAGFPEGPEGERTRFEPVPRDRDWALAHLDGVKMVVTLHPWPHYVGFDFDYPSAFRLTWTGRVLDRRVLPELTWADWKAVAQELMDSLPDPVLEEAVERLPPSHFQAVGPDLIRALKNRRDNLMDFAREYYLLQAEAVDIRATDKDERVAFDRLPGDSLRVTIVDLESTEGGEIPYFERTFSGDETDEVRVYLQGGDDEARIQGLDEGKIRITVIGGGGDDVMGVAGGGSGKRVRFFDDRGDNRFEPGPSTPVDERSYTDPHDWREDSHWAGTRDWGSRTIIFPHFQYDSDGGFLLGGSLNRTGYGFRHDPYQNRTRLTVGYGSRTQKPHVEGDVEFPLYRQRVQGLIYGLASGANVHRFYGFGNETGSDEELEVYQAFGNQYRLGAAAKVRVSPRLEVEIGGRYSLSDPQENLGTILAQEEPYGFTRFNSFSLGSSLRWNNRDDEDWPTSGTGLEVSGELFPTLGDVESVFGKVASVGTLYLSSRRLPLGPTLALRAGGEKIWGEVPYQEAATLGGPKGLRGYPEERFHGDASLFLNSEARLRIGDLPTLIPGSWGTTLSWETGRVWFDDQDSDRWHGSYGGGIWASIIDTFTMTLSVSQSDEGTRFMYGGGGFYF